MKTTQRCPSHPGRVLKELYLDELGVTVTDFSGRKCRVSLRNPSNTRSHKAILVGELQS